MNRFAFRRLCVALMVLTFLVGLPMQGVAMTSQMSMAASGELPMPNGCTGCVDEPAINMTCPIVFCVGLSAVVVERTEFAQIPADTNWFTRRDAVVELAFSPDPHPPRTSIPA